MKNYLGIDYGERRIGLAFGDDDVYVATPIPAAVEKSLKERLEHIGSVIKKRRVAGIVIGYPFNMDGSRSKKMDEVDAFIEKLGRFGLPVYKVDERLTSHQVEADLLSLGHKPKKQSPKEKQAYRKSGDLDSRSATLILQDYLESINPYSAL